MYQKCHLALPSIYKSERDNALSKNSSSAIVRKKSIICIKKYRIPQHPHLNLIVGRCRNPLNKVEILEMGIYCKLFISFITKSLSSFAATQLHNNICDIAFHRHSYCNSGFDDMLCKNISSHHVNRY